MKNLAASIPKKEEVKMQRACFWLLQTVLIAAVAAPLAGCGDSADTDQVADVRIAVELPLDSANAKLRNASSLGAQDDGHHATVAITDVAKIMVDIINVSVTPNRVIFRNTELTRGTDGIWSATLPFLPRGVTLEFRSTASAADTAGGAALFTGVTQQTLTGPNGVVNIALKPIDNNNTLVIPRISRISVPTELSSAGSGSITVAVEGASGDVITFTATPAANGGELFPQTGSLTLAGTSGTLVFQYVAPTLNAQQTFEHSIEIQNPRGTRVRSNFSTRVLQVGQTPGTSGTGLRVQFSPIINNLVARRVPNSSTIEWQAEVSDDRPTNQDLLTYNWEFQPDATYTPAPAFGANSRATTMSNYDTAVSGTIQLQVTDADGGTTTLKWVLPVNQFLAQSDLIVDVGNVGGVASVVAGGAHTCARLTNGSISCWGRGSEGQRGYGNAESSGHAPNTLPYSAGSIPNLEQALQVSAGTQHTCALFNNGQVACWGNNSYGQLGYNTTQSVGDNESVASYGFVNIGGNAVRIAAGGNHTCAILDTGSVRCWGQNNRGQLGYARGTTATPGANLNVGDNEAPYSVGDVNLGGALVSDVVAGNEHTCVLLRTGNVRCWGANNFGQLGYGRNDDIGDNEIPLAADLDFNLATIRQLAAGGNHTCALLANSGAVRCWGSNSKGQLGIAALYNATNPANPNWGDSANETPHQLQGQFSGGISFGPGRVALQISAGNAHTCATLDTGSVRCWGANNSGQLGLGTTNMTSPNTIAASMQSAPGGNVSLGASVVRLASGADHNCVLLTTGRVRCWGLGAEGQLGYGATINIGDNEQADAAGPVALLGP
ncbi:RTX toxin [Archangium sp.]|uniref:RCC1 domain-containing protein n=1 Tax=Archangium sp. TaxID=1872627 RepID=UPI002D25F2DA|nr:RTX toxin [Archangium sp.]HYO51666.1 RTX toxin [Archangium sp.]